MTANTLDSRAKLLRNVESLHDLIQKQGRLRPLWLSGVVFGLLLILFQGIYLVGASDRHERYQQQVLEEIKLRVSVDLSTSLSPTLDGGSSLDQERLQRYVSLINDYNREHALPVTLSGLVAERPLNSNYFSITTHFEGPFYVVYRLDSHAPSHLISPIPACFALFFAYLFYIKAAAFRSRSRELALTAPEKTLLVVDFEKRVLVHVASGREVSMANKPLCFYAALSEYCLKHPDSALHIHREIPEELLVLSKQYFRTLIGLGHTVRKRPDFGNNLEKTLSDIRSALDELFGDDVSNKHRVYPRKAIGEGSRSRLHNYALIALDRHAITIKGQRDAHIQAVQLPA